MEKIRIFWSGPYSIASCIDKFCSYNDFGIYAITRYWGDCETLLYIGRVYWRTFAERITEHQREWLNELRGTLKVRIGRIKLGYGKNQSLGRMDDIEKLLILAHTPMYNSQSTISCDVRDLTILNFGRKGPLNDRVCSNDFEKL